MFFQLTKEAFVPVEMSEINPDRLTVAYLTIEELEQYYSSLGIDYSIVENCNKTTSIFRSEIEVNADYTFTE